ncbi:NAD(P)-dependent oxidoreductase [Pedobacter sp. Leaf176]|uniref:NAD(P)-dependent oxidoreductase n=1 Tax=Pedobacter sp. Leaf176 TaxID=1736286 RepID=UPI0006FEDD5B|nr:NAD(P)-dependent oxidoreductase [Pedobacter sp. Leaf176]KQR72660.1 6-phosphogluconate dehydrogenase [Pedobacter sp. Leaf176]
MEKTKIGWIGLGNMGIPMVSQLIKAAHYVTVYNRSKDKADFVKNAGAFTAPTPKELLNNSDIIFVMVSDDEAINQIFKGEEGLFAGDIAGKIIVNMSTVSPGISKDVAAACKKNEAFYLDAPVSGSVKQAETGTLVIMVGGDEIVFEKIKPVLEKLGKLVMLIGGNGAGNYAKLAINALLALYAQGLAETIVFANQNGVETEGLLELINNAAIGNLFTTIKGDAILQNNFKPAFALKHIVKDLGLAKAEGLSSPLANAAFGSFQNAEAELGEEDIIAIIKTLK